VIAVEQYMFRDESLNRLLNRFETVLKLKDIIAAEAKKNQKAAGGAVSLKSGKAVKAKPVTAIHTDKILARKAGVSPDTITKVEFILERADQCSTALSKLRWSIQAAQ